MTLTRFITVLAFVIVPCACDKASPVPQSGQPAPPPVAGTTPLTVAERLAACAKLYANAKTCRDRGEVQNEFPKFTTRLPFSTAFERGGRFLWEYRDTKDNFQYLVWSDDAKNYKSHWTVRPGTDTFTTVDDALAGPTGISGRSAVVFNSLLMPQMQWGVGTLLINNAKEVGSETVEGVPCTKIQGTDYGGDAVALWLDSSSAIRKLARGISLPHPKGGTLNVQTIITVTPTFDGPIGDDAFARPASAK